MALFTDGLISSIDDLLAYESSILDVARTEGIDLVVKLELAEQEIGIELAAFLVQHSESTPGLESVAVTEPLRKWHTFHTLALVYRDAHSRQLNDRYLAKWKEADRLSKWASSMLFQSGVGIVEEPLERAERPELSTTPGAAAGGTYYVRAAWVNALGEEGAPSDLAILTALDGSLLQVRAVNPPGNAQSWNVYVGLSHSELALQNAQPLGRDEFWTASDSGLSGGRSPGTGQDPDYYVLAGATRRGAEQAETPGRLLRG